VHVQGWPESWYFWRRQITALGKHETLTELSLFLSEAPNVSALAHTSRPQFIGSRSRCHNIWLKTRNMS